MQFGSQRWPKVATGNRKLFATNIRTSWHSFSTFPGANGKRLGVVAKNQNISENFGQLMASLNFHLTFSFWPSKNPTTPHPTHTHIIFVDFIL